MTAARFATLVVLVTAAAACHEAVSSPRADETTTFAIDGAINSNPTVVSDGKRVVLAWIATGTSEANLFSASSTDGGRTFAAPVRVNAKPGDIRGGGEQAPKIALLPQHGIALTWASKLGGASQIRRAVSTDDGLTFVDASADAGTFPGARGWMSLAADTAGILHVVWLDAGHSSTSAAMNHAAGKMRQNIYHASWTGDQTLAQTQIAADVCFCCKTAVTVAGDGRVYAAWRHIYPTNLRDIAVASSIDGRTFSSPVRVSEDGWQIDACPEDGPSLAVTTNRNLYVAWPTVVEGSRKALFFSVSSDEGKTFSPRRRLDDGTGTPAHPQLSASGDRVVASWDQNAGDERHAWLRTLSGGTSQTTPAIRVDDGVRALYPSIALTPQGTMIAWVASVGDRMEIRLRRLPQ